MKCKVCGYEYNNSKPACPVCGTRNEKFSAEDLDQAQEWNTRNIPKPSAEASSGRTRWYSPELAEGYVSVPTKNDRQAEKRPDYTARYEEENAVEMPAPARTAVLSDFFENEAAEQDGSFDVIGNKETPFEFRSGEEKSYTFRDKNEEFQKLLDKEFNRIKRNQKEEISKQKDQSRFERKPVLPESLSRYGELFGQAGEASNEKPKSVARKERPMAPLMDTLPKTYSGEPKPIGSEADSYIDSLEKSIEQYREEENNARKESEERRKKLDAMAAAKEAYLKAMEGVSGTEDTTFGFNTEKGITKKEKEEESGAIEELSLSELLSEIKSDKEKEFTITIDPSGRIKGITSQLTLEAIAGMLQEDAEQTSKFDREAFIEAQNEELRRMEETEEFFAEFEEADEEPAEEVIAEPEEEIAEEVIAEPEEEPAEEVIAEPEEEIAEEVIAEPEEEFAEEVIAEPEEEPAEEVIAEPEEEPAEEEIEEAPEEEEVPEEPKKVYEVPVIVDQGGPFYSNFKEEVSFDVLSTETPDIPAFKKSVVIPDEEPVREQPLVHIPEDRSKKEENTDKYDIPNIDVDGLFDSLSKRAFSNPSYELAKTEEAEEPKAPEKKIDEHIAEKTRSMLEKMTAPMSPAEEEKVKDATDLNLDSDVPAVTGFIFNEPKKPNYAGSENKVFKYTFNSIASDVKNSSKLNSENQVLIEKLESEKTPPLWDVTVNGVEITKAEEDKDLESEIIEDVLDIDAPENRETEPVLFETEAPEIVKIEAPKIVKTEARKIVKTEEPEIVKTEAPKENKTKAVKVLKSIGMVFVTALCFIVVIQLIVLCVVKLWSDSAFSKILIQISEAIQDAFNAAIRSVFKIR